MHMKFRLGKQTLHYSSALFHPGFSEFSKGFDAARAANIG